MLSGKQNPNKDRLQDKRDTATSLLKFHMSRARAKYPIILQLGYQAARSLRFA